MNPDQALWENGDFTRIAASMRESGEAFVGKLGIKNALKVLDLGCGDGITALPSAKFGADVLAFRFSWNRGKPLALCFVVLPIGKPLPNPACAGSGFFRKHSKAAPGRRRLSVRP